LWSPLLQWREINLINPHEHKRREQEEEREHLLGIISQPLSAVFAETEFNFYSYYPEGTLKSLREAERR
jgi:hypothetical protein